MRKAAVRYHWDSQQAFPGQYYPFFRRLQRIPGRTYSERRTLGRCESLGFTLAYITQLFAVGGVQKSKCRPRG